MANFWRWGIFDSASAGPFTSIFGNNSVNILGINYASDDAAAEPTNFMIDLDNYQTSNYLAISSIT